MDPGSPNLATQYAALTAEMPPFAEYVPLEALKQFAGVDVLAFDFTPGRSSSTNFTVLIVTFESVDAEQRSQSTRNYLYQLRGAMNYSSRDIKVAGSDGKTDHDRVSGPENI